MFEDILNYEPKEKPKFLEISIMGEIIDADPKWVYIRYHEPSDGLDYVIGYNGGFGVAHMRVIKIRFPAAAPIKIGEKVNIILERKENGNSWYQNVYKRYEYSYWKRRKDRNNPVKEWEKALHHIYIVAVEIY